METLRLHGEDEMIPLILILTGSLLIEHWFGAVLVALGVLYVCAR